MRTMQVFRILLLTVFFASSPLVSPAFAAQAKPAAAPQIFITWQTNTTAPAEYAGKLLPNKTSPVQASVFALLDNRVLDLTAVTISWYANNRFVSTGKGNATATIPAEEPSPEQLTIRVVLRGISNEDISSSITLPIRPPVLALLTPSVTALRSNLLQLKAIPFFFTDTQGAPLQYRWNVNGRIRSVVDNLLVLDTAQAGRNQEVKIQTDAANPGNPIESATTELMLVIP